MALIRTNHLKLIHILCNSRYWVYDAFICIKIDNIYRIMVEIIANEGLIERLGTKKLKCMKQTKGNGINRFVRGHRAFMP